MDKTPPRRSLRKRKHDPQSDTPQKGKGRKKRSNGLADPFVSLNEDIINIILTYIPPADVVRCERVSRGWQETVKAWIETFGVRTQFPQSWNHALNTSSYASFKDLARQFHLLQAGKPSFVCQTRDVGKVVFAGDYGAWTSNPSPLLSSTKKISDRVFWRCLTPREDGTMAEPEVLPATRFFRPPGPPVRISHVAMNSDGILLLQLEPDIHSSHYPPGRYLVYSPGEKQVLWRQDYNRREERAPSPVLIGKRLVYAVVTEKDAYKVEAFDFRTNELLYQSPSHHRPWQMNGYTHLHRLLKFKSLFFKLFRASDGEEYILELSSQSASDKPTISVIHGGNGHRVRTVNFPECRLDAFMAHPTGSAVAIVSPAPAMPKPSIELDQTHRIIVIRRFACQPGDPLSPLPADVIFAPRELLGEPHNRLHNLSVAVSPFTYTAISSCPPSSAASYPPWNVGGHSLVPTTDEEFHTAAKAVIQENYPTKTPSLGDCFILGRGNFVTLPPRPEIGRKNRVNLVLAKGYETWDISLKDGNGVSVRHGTYAYLLMF